MKKCFSEIKWINVLVSLCKILITTFLVVSLAVLIAGDFKKLKQRFDRYQKETQAFDSQKRLEMKANMKSLNQALPQSFDHLIAVSEGKVKPDKKKLRDYQKYYELVVELVDGPPDAYGLLGFIYYQQGEKEKADKAYKQAILGKPEFFWYYYNLGVIHYEQKNFAEAARYLGIATNKDIGSVFKGVLSSKIYAQIMSGEGFKQEKLLFNYWDSLKNAYKLLIEAFVRVDDYSQVFDIAIKAINANFDTDGYFSYYGGVAAFKSKKYSVAVTLFQEAIQKNPDYPDAYYFLGMTMEALGFNDQSQVFFRKAAVLKNTLAPKEYFDAPEVHVRIF